MSLEPDQPDEADEANEADEPDEPVTVDDEPATELRPGLAEPRLINLTIRVDDYVLLHARWRAMREGTSINAVLADFLSNYAGVATRVIHHRTVRPIRPRTIYEEARRAEGHRKTGW